MLLIEELLLQIAILTETCIKCVIFIEKLQKSPSAARPQWPLEAPPPHWTEDFIAE